MRSCENKSARVSLLFLCLFVVTSAVQALENIPYVFGHRSYGSDIEDSGDPEMMYTILARLQRLGQTIRANVNDVENSKRGLDLGLSRGYSGSQQAKHMMGIAAAGLSGGPGRRRRSQDTYRYGIPY